MSHFNSRSAPSLHAAAQSRMELIIDNVFFGFCYYAVTSLVAILGTLLGHEMFKPAGPHVPAEGDLILAFGRVDGSEYAEIASQGYSYSRQTASSVAFFPAYPILARFLALAGHLPPSHALLILSHVCLAGTFIILTAYTRRRFGTERSDLVHYTLLAFGLFPTTMFFRMTYSESMFLLFAALVLYSIDCRWPLVVTSGIVGFATATRPVGVALLIPLALAIWDRFPKWRPRVLTLLVFVPLATWGLASFMVYQHLAFNDALAFAKTQEYWRLRPPSSLAEKANSLLTLEPIWSVFDTCSLCYWKRQESHDNPLFSLVVANPIYFLLAIILIIIGARKRWLNRYEFCVALSLLAIPYLTRSYEMCMAAMGRFCAVVIPMYFVLGHVLAKSPRLVSSGFLIISSVLLAVYAALFAAGHRVW